MRTRIAPAILALLAFATAPLEAQSLSRAEAVGRALEVNPEVRKGVEDLVRLNGLITEAKADALPELTAYGTFNRYRDPAFLNSSSFDSFPPEFKDQLRPIPANLYEGTAQIRQTLFSFKLGHAIKAARFGRRYGEADLQRVRQGVSLLAVQAYNDYLLSLERARIAGRSVRQKEIQLEVARNRRVAGVATDLEVLRFEVNLENERAALVREEGLAELARGRLNAVMVRPIDDPITPTDALVYVPCDIAIEDAVRAAWENRPEAKAIDLARRVRNELVGVAAGESRPSLEFNGVYGWSVREPSNFFNQDYTKWTYGFSLKIPLFDGFRTAGRVSQARAELHKVEQDRVALENEIRLEAKDAVERLRAARKVLQAADLAVSQAQKALDMTEASYKLGAASTLDVLDAQAAFILAQSNRIQALYTHANARASLRYVMGGDPLDDTPVAPTAEPGTAGNERS
jgi:outer membrane protein TolC